MKNFLLISLVSIFLFGCSHMGAKVEGIFITYPRDTFIIKTTGETGLSIVDEDWYTLINTPDFIDVDEKFTSPDQFLYRRNTNGVLLSVFAEKFDKEMDSESCLNCYISRLKRMDESLAGKIRFTNDIKTYRDRKILIRDSSAFGMKSTSVHYYPYYKGYCFDFHFTVSPFLDNEEDYQEVINNINSIEFKDGKPSDIIINRLFYIYYKRLQLSYSGDWNCSIQKASLLPYKISSIKFEPKIGNDFMILVSPIEGFRNSKKTPEEVKAMAIDTMNVIGKDAVEKPKLLEKNKNEMSVYYYDFTDKNYNSNDPQDYPLLRQGFASINGSVLYFSIFYKDTSAAISQQGLDLILESRILDLMPKS